MKSYLFCILLLVALCGTLASARKGGLSVSANKCPMSQTKTKPSKEKLEYCAHYSESSCCTPAEDLAVQKEINVYWRSLTGHCPGCLNNAKRFMCAWHCSPDMLGFVNPKPAGAAGSKKTGVIKMCGQFCNSWYQSCVNTSIAEKFGSSAINMCTGMIDTSSGNTIEVRGYDCFNDADAANTCEGDTIPPLPKSTTNLWFIITCVVLSITGCVLILAIFVSDSPSGPGSMAAEWQAVNRDDKMAATPLFRSPADEESDVGLR